MRSPAVEEARQILHQHRNTRKRPLLDDKVLTEWNAMMLATLAEAAFFFESDEWLQAAIRNGEFLVRELRTAQGNWHRSWQESGSPQARHRALAADLAQLVDAFTRLGEASGQARWITYAQEAADEMLRQCWDAVDGGLFTTPDGQRNTVCKLNRITCAVPTWRAYWQQPLHPTRRPNSAAPRSHRN